MGWARERGCIRYDLGGIASDTPHAGTAGAAEPGRSDNLAGVHQFKTGFGGEIVTYPGTVERRYRPTLAWLARRVSSRYRGTPDTSAGSRTLVPDVPFPLI